MSIDRNEIEKIAAVNWPSYHKLKRELPESLKDLYTKVEWEQPYYEVAKQFLWETLPRLWRLGRPEDVRIVYFFDN